MRRRGLQAGSPRWGALASQSAALHFTGSCTCFEMCKCQWAAVHAGPSLGLPSRQAPPSLTVMLGPARWQRQPPHQHCGPGARQLTHLHPHRAASWAPGGRAVTPGREESPSSSGSMLTSSPSLASGHVRPVHAASLGSREPSPTGRRSWDQWAGTQGGCLQLTLWTGTMLAPSGTCWALFGKLSFLLQTVFPRGGTRPLST